MSVQAISWALEEAPGVAPGLVSTLIGLANHAGKDGRAAYPGIDTLATYTRKSYRQVQRDLEELAAAGLIRPGDQQHVSHLRADRRPRVWDLAVERKRSRGDTHDTPSSSNGTTHMTPRKASRGDTGVVPSDKARGDTHDTPSPDHGTTPETERGDTHVVHGVTPTSTEPSLEPSVNHKPPRADSQRKSRPRATPGAHPAPVAAAELDANAVAPNAYALVARWRAGHSPPYRARVYRELGRHADNLLRDGADPEHVLAALQAWDHRDNAAPGLLPHLHDDAVRRTRPTTPQLSATDRRIAEAEALKDNPDPAVLAAAGLPIPPRLRALPGGAS